MHIAGQVCDEASIQGLGWLKPEECKEYRRLARTHACADRRPSRNGRRTVVVVDAEEWERRTQRTGSLADFFRASPLRGSGLKVRRSKDRLRIRLLGPICPSHRLPEARRSGRALRLSSPAAEHYWIARPFLERLTLLVDECVTVRYLVGLRPVPAHRRAAGGGQIPRHVYTRIGI